jgi:adenylate cyclase
VEVLAGAVAAGIARQDEERSRSRLAEFFSPRVAEQLALRPELLTGQDAEVSVLFCDIRGFSSISERVGPTKTIEWLNDVLTELSQCVVDRDGVLVDYVGDQLMAMWGAPQPQADHAKRGIEAAVEMMQRVRVLRSRWQERLPLTFAVGIGLNTGIARVGNIGSRLKFKYGVLGNTVNIGSRLQDATKQFGADCMAAEATVRSSNLQDRCRRLAVLNVVGIDSPIEVYEVIRASDQAWTALRNTYEAALVDFESRRFAEATEKLGHLVQTYPQDRPCKLLLRRAVAELSEPSADFTHVWKLTSK